MSRRIDSVEQAFADQPVIRNGIYEALRERPHSAQLFNDISRYILSINPLNQPIANGSDEHPSKKRKLDESMNGKPTQTASTDTPRRVILEARDISFSLPQRKKLHLGIVQYGSSLNEKGSTFAIQARNPATSQVEFEFPTSSFSHALRLPIPEKNQKQYNFCLLPARDNEGSVEPLIWTVNHGPLKSLKIEDPDLSKIAPGPEDVLEKSLDFVLGQSEVKLTLPSEAEFASALRESHRKADVAYHVKAFRGSKEGYLFFLETGIFFGFKKPLSFFPFNEIESISYTSVLQRTFNLNITIRVSSEAEAQEIEYSMLDQADFPGIDAYIKNHELQDASLADARRAKKAKANGTKPADTTAEDDGRTELEKAEAELQDEEDEMEEDYDPEAEGDDESGSESGDEDYNGGKGHDLLEEELGSEAEDVSASDEEEDDENNAEDDDVKDEETSKKPSRPVVPLKHDSRAPGLDDEDQL